MRVVLAADHAGFKGKENARKALEEMGHTIIEIGAEDESPIDFPDVAFELARLILSDRADRGIMICGTGIGAAMATNRIPGIRSALAHDIYSAHQCVEHDNANVLCLGADVVGNRVAADLINEFMTSEWLPDEEFHVRVAKLEGLSERVTQELAE